MKSINSHIRFLSLFASASRQQRKALLQSMTKSQQHTLLEVVFNVAKGTVEVSSWHKTILKRYKRIIRQVIDGQVGEKKESQLASETLRHFSTYCKNCFKANTG